jgi:hypothetical protein
VRVEALNRVKLVSLPFLEHHSKVEDISRVSHKRSNSKLEGGFVKLELLCL